MEDIKLKSAHAKIGYQRLLPQELYSIQMTLKTQDIKLS